MMFDFIEKTAGAAVDVTLDSIGFMATGEPPKREDVKQLVAAGITVGAIALALGWAEDQVQAISDGSDGEE